MVDADEGRRESKGWPWGEEVRVDQCQRASSKGFQTIETKEETESTDWGTPDRQGSLVSSKEPSRTFDQNITILRSRGSTVYPRDRDRDLDGRAGG